MGLRWLDSWVFALLLCSCSHWVTLEIGQIPNVPRIRDRKKRGRKSSTPPCPFWRKTDREIMLSQWLTVGGDKSRHEWSGPEQRGEQPRLPPLPLITPPPQHTAWRLQTRQLTIITLISPSKRPQACLPQDSLF